MHDIFRVYIAVTAKKIVSHGIRNQKYMLNLAIIILRKYIK